MKRIRAVGTEPFVEGPLDLASRPAFAKRGMHFNGWPFNYPYSFRRWKQEDWNRFVDVLAYDGANLFYLWPFIEIMPVPLSKQDEAYLQECRRVIGYAQERHGMEVWIMQCTNRVAKDDCGVIDPRRGRIGGLPRRTSTPPIRNSSAGSWPRARRCTASSTMRRSLQHRFRPRLPGRQPFERLSVGAPGVPSRIGRAQSARQGGQAGQLDVVRLGLRHERYFDPDHQKATIDLLRQDLSEPWWLVNGRFEFLPVCRQAGVLNKTVLLPYGVIEGSLPIHRRMWESMASAPRSRKWRHVPNWPE